MTKGGTFHWLTAMLAALLIWGVGSTTAQAQAPVNDDCDNATVLTSVNSGGFELCNQTTKNGTTQNGEVTTGSCILSTFSQTVWYKFTATSTQMYIQLRVTGLAPGQGGGGWCYNRLTAILYNTATCIPGAGAIHRCKVHGADSYLILKSDSLTVGIEYLVQVGYNNSQGCKVPQFCIEVGNYETCATCQNICGPACGFTSYPTIPQVVASCPPYELEPPLDGGETHTACYNFQANGANDTVGLIINSNCGSFNVTAFAWELYEATCGNVIQSGNLNNMIMTGLTPGQEYRICYTLTVPSTCNHFNHYPYIVGASTLLLPLDIALTANYSQQSVYLEWTNLDCQEAIALELEMSTDGRTFNPVKAWDCSGEYWLRNFRHIEAPYGRVYYRIKATEPDGYISYSNIASVLVPVGNDLTWNWTSANPLEADALQAMVSAPSEMYTILVVSNIQGSTVLRMPIQLTRGQSHVSVPLPILPAGLYVVAVFGDHGPISHWKFVKQ